MSGREWRRSATRSHTKPGIMSTRRVTHTHRFWVLAVLLESFALCYDKPPCRYLRSGGACRGYRVMGFPCSRRCIGVELARNCTLPCMDDTPRGIAIIASGAFFAAYSCPCGHRFISSESKAPIRSGRLRNHAGNHAHADRITFCSRSSRSRP